MFFNTWGGFYKCLLWLTFTLSRTAVMSWITFWSFVGIWFVCLRDMSNITVPHTLQNTLCIRKASVGSISTISSIKSICCRCQWSTAIRTFLGGGIRSWSSWMCWYIQSRASRTSLRSSGTDSGSFRASEFYVMRVLGDFWGWLIFDFCFWLGSYQS